MDLFNVWKSKQMKIWLITFLIILVGDSVNGVEVHKVKFGETAILPCLSDDKLHRFQYWQLKTDEIIGPWNNNQKDKFRYEVWTGRLIIRSVSETESGFYKCFSKQILGSELRSETVELLVTEDWEDDFNNDSKVNAYKGGIALGALILLFLVLIIFYMKRRRAPRFQELRGDSSEDIVTSSNSRGVYTSTSVNMPKPPPNVKKATAMNLESAVVETDISTSFLLSN